jgi:hypothetical protein
MEGTHQLLLCVNYFRLFGNNVTNTKENTGTPLVISNGDGLLIHWGGEIECIFTSGYEEAEEDHRPTFAVWEVHMFGDDTKIKIVFTKKARTDKNVKTIMKLPIPLMARHLINIQATVSLLRAAVDCEVWIPHFGKEFMEFSL